MKANSKPALIVNVPAYSVAQSTAYASVCKSLRSPRNPSNRILFDRLYASTQVTAHRQSLIANPNL